MTNTPIPAEPKVSVMIIAYNQEKYIVEALEGAISQDYANFEVVVSDDASTDRTPRIIQDYADRYPGRVIAVLNSKNRGVTGNSNAGLRACSGDLIAFMGGDDVLLPGKIAAQVAWFRQSPGRVLCGHQVEVFYEDGSRPPHPLTRRLESGRGAEKIIRNGTFGATAVMVRADRVPPHGFDERLPVVSDHMLWVDVLADGGEFGFVDGTFARYRRHDANVTNDAFANVGDVARFLQIVTERYPQYCASCRHAATRRLHYDVGVDLMKAGRKAEARAKFVQALRREPTFAKAWVRMVQCFV